MICWTGMRALVNARKRRVNRRSSVFVTQCKPTELRTVYNAERMGEWEFFQFHAFNNGPDQYQCPFDADPVFLKLCMSQLLMHEFWYSPMHMRSLCVRDASVKRENGSLLVILLRIGKWSIWVLSPRLVLSLSIFDWYLVKHPFAIQSIFLRIRW